MSVVARGLFWLIALSCGACSREYWLGGTRGEDSGSVTGEDDRSDAGGGDGAPSAADGAKELVLDDDIVLTGDQSLALPEAGTGGCHVVGNGHQIRSEGTWRGQLSMRGCLVEGLGSATKRALSLAMSGEGSMMIEDSTFRRSGAIHVSNADESTTTFRNNVIEENSLVRLDPSADATVPAFFADGDSQSAKFFQGNRSQRSTAWFQSPNWLIGGSDDADSNIFLGLRAGIVLAASGLVVRGNYVHGQHFEGAGDESAVLTIYGTDDTLAEHNVLRSGTWVLRGFGGELRYNAVLDPDYSAWLQQPFENTKVHHNLFLMCHPAPKDDIQAGIYLVNNRAAGIQIYNNTLDAGGSAMKLSGAAIVIDEGCSLASLRSNAFLRFPFQRNDGGAGAIRPGLLEGVVPPPVRLGYADYNLFYNPEGMDARNYRVSVSGRTLRRDDGFAAHDAPVAGALDAQVDPGPLGLAGGCFPWSDDEIAASRVTVSQIVAALRVAYKPARNSTLLRAGDPADGPANPIGAIGDGNAADDLFGTFGR
jgi:hypothetical protein